MFCRKCGAKIPDESEFCPECGTKIVRNAGSNDKMCIRDRDSGVGICRREPEP